MRTFIMNNKHLIHKHSNVIEDYTKVQELRLFDKPKKPTTEDILDGELAINNKKGYESLFIKNNENEIINLFDNNNFNNNSNTFIWNSSCTDKDDFVYDPQNNKVYTLMHLMAFFSQGSMRADTYTDILRYVEEKSNINFNEELLKMCNNYSMDFWTKLYKYSVNHTDLIIKSCFIKNPSLYLMPKNTVWANNPIQANLNYSDNAMNWKCQIYSYFYSGNKIVLQFVLENNYCLENPSYYPQYCNKIPFFIMFNFRVNSSPNEHPKYETIEITSIDNANFGIRNLTLSNEVIGCWNNSNLYHHIVFDYQKIPNSFNKYDLSTKYNIRINDDNENDLKIEIKKDEPNINA